jgi:hypothetical protein
MGWFGKNKKSSQDATGTAEQKWAAFLSDCENVQNIVTEYGNVIDMASKMSYGAPQSLLPRPKAELSSRRSLSIQSAYMRKMSSTKKCSMC